MRRMNVLALTDPGFLVYLTKERGSHAIDPALPSLDFWRAVGLWIFALDWEALCLGNKLFVQLGEGVV